MVLSALINTLADPTLGVKHFERPAGSFIPTFRGMSDEGHLAVALLHCISLKVVWDDVTVQAQSMGCGFGHCRYFQATLEAEGVNLLKGCEPLEACCPLGQLSPEELSTVRVVRGAHGVELQATGTPRETRLITVIVGNGKDPFTPPEWGNVQVFTWYPGGLTPKVDIDLPEGAFPADLAEAYANATVKFI